MLLQELIHRHEFSSIVPHLTAIEPDKVPDNLYAFKEAFDDLRRMKPADSAGEQIVISTEVETDENGTEIERYLWASNCEGEAWDACLAKEVIFDTTISEEKALAQILWHLTFFGFTPAHEGFRDDKPRNKYERQAATLEYRQFCNYARIKPKKKPLPDDLHYGLTLEEWDVYHRREAHRNRPKRMRDARQNRSVARLQRSGKVQYAIDRISSSVALSHSVNLPHAGTPSLTAILNSSVFLSGAKDLSSYLSYLFNTAVICEHDLYSRTATPEGRAEYLAENLQSWFRPNLSDYTRAEVLITSSLEHPLRMEEIPILQASLEPILTPSITETRYHFGADPTLGPDLHIFLLLNR